MFVLFTFQRFFHEYIYYYILYHSNITDTGCKDRNTDNSKSCISIIFLPTLTNLCYLSVLLMYFCNEIVFRSFKPRDCVYRRQTPAEAIGIEAGPKKRRKSLPDPAALGMS